MACAHRSLVRLPLDVYTDLISSPDRIISISEEEEEISPEELRRQVCAKLKKFPSNKKNKSQKNGTYESITTVGQLLTRTTPLTLLKVLDPLLTFAEIHVWLDRVARVCCPSPQTALELLRQQETTTRASPQPFFYYLPTGLSSLDACLRGGIRIGSVTEFCGRAGTGKTQLAMQVCVMAALQQHNCGSGSGSVYLDTEQKLSVTRLDEMAHERASNNKRRRISSQTTISSPQQQPMSGSAERVLDNITVLSPRTMPDLMTALLQVEELVLETMADTSTGTSQQLQQRLPIRLLVIDSIAAPTKRGNESAPERAAALFACAQRLKQMADQLQLAILVVNQVTLEQQQQSQLHQRNGSNSNNTQKVRVKAALGTSWHHCVSTRIMLEQQSPLQQQTPTQAVSLQQQQQCHPVSQSPHGHSQQQQPSMGNRSNHRPTAPVMVEPPRIATIVKSNLVGLQSVKYQLVTEGVVDAKSTTTTTTEKTWPDNVRCVQNTYV